MSDGRKAVGLPNRGVIKVSGDEARAFLDRIVTADMAGAMPDKAIHTALLTPQGKIIADFMVTEAEQEDGGGFFCDVPLVAVSELIKKLSLYKLRAKVTIEDLSSELGVVAVWDKKLTAVNSGLTFVDPRLADLGLRVISHRSQTAAIAEAYGVAADSSAETDLAAYHQHRAMLGIAEPVFDYLPGDTFPHEINMDQLGGVNFQKGCYIGQEVVSRVQHRGSARSRIVPLATENGFCVAEGADVMAGEKLIGKTGTGGIGMNLGLIRLDKAADAVASGLSITAGGVEVHVMRPNWWKADWPFASS